MILNSLKSQAKELRVLVRTDIWAFRSLAVSISFNVRQWSHKNKKFLLPCLTVWVTNDEIKCHKIGVIFDHVQGPEFETLRDGK